MRKIKGFLLAVLAAVLALTVPLYAACEVDKDDPNKDYVPPAPVTTELISIDINTNRVKTEYYAGENFTSANLVVTATTKRSDRDDTDVRDVTSSASVNSSAFRRTRVGEYEIFVSYTLDGTTKMQSYKVTVKDVTLKLHAQDVKNLYLVGEELDLTGYTAEATTMEHGKDPVTVDVTDKVKMDTSAFDNTKEGVYPITASYSLPNGDTRTDSFEVSVMASREGLNVQLAAGVSQTINLTAGNKTASIDASQIVVKTVNEYGVVNDTPITSGYTVEVYKENVLINPTSGTTYSNLPSGAYQIWASMPSANDSSYTLSGFALIYIVEDIVPNSFKFKEGTTTQDIGIDVMTSTWKYEVQYVTSSTPTVITADEVVVTDVDTLNITNNGLAYVYYTYTMANGVNKTISTTVPYKVTMNENQAKDTNSFDYSDLPSKTDKTPLATEDFTGVNSFISYIGGDTQYRTNPECIEIRGDVLQVTFKGMGTLAISCTSTNATNLSSIGLKDAEGNYVSATWDQKVTFFTELQYEKGNMYQVAGAKTDDAGSAVLTFIISKPGTYTICTNDYDPEGSQLFPRYTRIFELVKTDIYDKTQQTQVLTDAGDVNSVDLYSEELKGSAE